MVRDTHPRPGFTSYASLATWLAAQPAGVNPTRPLYKIGQGANDANIIAEFGRIGSVIVPKGPVYFDRCTTSSVGVAGAVAGAVITLAAGYVWARTSGTLRIWNRTTGAEGGDYEYTRAVDELTVPAAAAVVVANALGAGQTIDLWDTATEFSVGGATRGIQLGALGRASFAAAGLVWPVQSSETVFHLAPMASSLRAVFGSWNVPDDGDRVLMGVRNVTEIMWGPCNVLGSIRTHQLRSGVLSAASGTATGLVLEATNGPHVSVYQMASSSNIQSVLHAGQTLPTRLLLVSAAGTIASLAVR
jgi:hypothetical protein